LSGRRVRRIFSRRDAGSSASRAYEVWKWDCSRAVASWTIGSAGASQSIKVGSWAVSSLKAKVRPAALIQKALVGIEWIVGQHSIASGPNSVGLVASVSAGSLLPRPDPPPT
jgi:hypothetical protein